MLICVVRIFMKQTLPIQNRKNIRTMQCTERGCVKISLPAHRLTGRVLVGKISLPHMNIHHPGTTVQWHRLLCTAETLVKSTVICTHCVRQPYNLSSLLLLLSGEATLYKEKNSSNCSKKNSF